MRFALILALHYILYETYDCILQYVQFSANSHNFQTNNYFIKYRYITCNRIFTIFTYLQSCLCQFESFLSCHLPLCHPKFHIIV